jgi:hypothetical protein
MMFLVIFRKGLLIFLLSSGEMFLFFKCFTYGLFMYLTLIGSLTGVD